jgi:hypothetical protein
MKWKFLASLMVGLALVAPASAQLMGDYLDVGIVSVKPEKRAQFESIVKTMVDANRKHQGDTWLTLEVMYGPGNAFTYVTPRKTYAAVETAYGSFMGALQKSLGEAGTGKLMQDWNNCLSSSRSEFRRRRWDLSANAPGDEAGLAALVGQARWIRMATIRVRPGHAHEYEEQLRLIKKARESASTKVPSLVSQSVVGQSLSVFYVSTLVKSLGDLDNVPGVPQVLGEEGYKAYQKTSAEAVLNAEVTIFRIVPELSRMPESVVSAAPDFWKPKPAAPAKPKMAAAAPAPKQ